MNNLPLDDPFGCLQKLEDIVKNSGKKINCNNSTPLSSNACFYSDGIPVVQPFVVFDGPIFLGDNVVIGPYTFLRGPLYIGKNTKIGPYCEIARSIILSNTCVSHKNILLDSLIGNDVWLSGGVTICNTRLDKGLVKINWKSKTECLNKFGVIIEDGSKIGVGVTIMPGTHVAAKSVVFGPSTIKGSVS